MDAVHNIPDLMTRWASCDETLLRGMLADLDRKWAHTGCDLLGAYDEHARNS
jgi:hypothetical protein